MTTSHLVLNTKSAYILAYKHFLYLPLKLQKKPMIIIILVPISALDKCVDALDV